MDCSEDKHTWMTMSSYLQQEAGVKGCVAQDGEKVKNFSEAALGNNLKFAVGACLHVHHPLQL